MNELGNWQSLHTLLRVSHVGLGFAGLGLFWIVVALRKGTRRHMLFGKLFVLIAYAVGGTAMFSSSWALVDIDSFAPFIGRLPSSVKQAELRDQFRFLFAILLYLSAATVTGAVYGVQLMRSKERHAELRRSLAPFWQMVCGVCALGLLIFGAVHLVGGVPSSAGIPWAAYQVPLFLGLVGTVGAWQELRYLYYATPSPHEFLYKHIEQMFGTGIGFHTAFIVFGASRLFGFQLSGIWALAPWIGPPVIGIALTSWYLRRLKRKNGEFGSTNNELRSEQQIAST